MQGLGELPSIQAKIHLCLSILKFRVDPLKTYLYYYCRFRQENEVQSTANPLPQAQKQPHGTLAFIL